MQAQARRPPGGILVEADLDFGRLVAKLEGQPVVLRGVKDALVKVGHGGTRGVDADVAHAVEPEDAVVARAGVEGHDVAVLVEEKATEGLHVAPAFLPARVDVVEAQVLARVDGLAHLVEARARLVLLGRGLVHARQQVGHVELVADLDQDHAELAFEGVVVVVEERAAQQPEQARLLLREVDRRGKARLVVDRVPAVLVYLEEQAVVLQGLLVALEPASDLVVEALGRGLVGAFVGAVFGMQCGADCCKVDGRMLFHVQCEFYKALAVAYGNIRRGIAR